MIALDNFEQMPRDYQFDAILAALAIPQGGRKMLSAPTGTGKGTIELGLLRGLLERGEKAAIVTPSLEVVRGYLERCGASVEDLSCGAGGLTKMGEMIHVYTPVRLRNLIRDKGMKPPTFLIIDEAHHATLDNITGGGLAELCPGATWVGFTATPFRGTPRETEELFTVWGEPHIVLTIPQAVRNGSWSLPKWRVEGIVDDDACNLKNGDLNADEITLTSMDQFVDLIKKTDLTKPTCITLPSVKAAKELASMLEVHSIEYRVVIGETLTPDRAEAYSRVAQGGALLISVKVLGEGVDLPWLRRWIDGSPTLSPVSFMQKLGRITRPGEEPSEYVGTNRNLERHGFLLAGLLPREELKKAQEKFGGGSKRGSRAGLIKCVAKLKPVPLPLAGGVQGSMWVMWQPGPMGGSGFERAILLDPTSERVISAIREIKPGNAKQGENVWMKTDLPEQMDGFRAARTAGICTDGQDKWWKRAGATHGLDTGVRPTKAQFFALPVLHDLARTMEHPDLLKEVATPATRGFLQDYMRRPQMKSGKA